MERSPPRLRRFPFWTAALVLGSLCVHLLPPVRETLIYHRPSILHGQPWRMLTGHLVHFAPGHLFVNLLAVFLAGGLIERLRPRMIPVLVISSALIISLAMLWFLPSLTTFGGLSGIASAEFAALAALGLAQGGLWRRAGLAILIVLVAKTAFDAVVGSSILALSSDLPFVPVPLAHAVGTLVGLTAGLAAAGSTSGTPPSHSASSSRGY